MAEIHGTAGQDFFHLSGDGLPVPAGFHEITFGPGSNSLFGEAGDDILHGGDFNARLIGGSGADLLSGGLGTDTADYSGSPAGVTVDLGFGTGHGGDAEGDTLVSIEGITGSALADTLTGDAGDDVL